MEKINLVELLKDCIGMELDCVMFDDVTLYRIDTDPENEYPIRIETKSGNFLDLTKYGTYSTIEESKCVIFPKGKITWEGFQRPFKDGDIIAFDSREGVQLFIFKEYIYNNDYAQCYMMLDCDGAIYFEGGDYYVERFATEEEKAKLFKSIRDNGYRWNPETKTLEELPKFKVGDRVESIYNYIQYDIKEITDTHYILVGVEDKYKYTEPISADEGYRLVLNKFDINTLKPFDKVLVRGGAGQKWTHDFFGFMDKDKGFPFVCVGNYVIQCIPYEGNEHLLGKTVDCEEYFKTWRD